MEEWRPVTFRGESWPYAISDLGRVVRVARGKRTYPGREVRWRLNPGGYAWVNLRYEQRMVYAAVHSLVAEAFLGPRPPRLEVNHISGNRLDNRLANLEYVSHRRNMQHMIENGLRNTARGERMGAAKLTATNVRDARALRAIGIPTARIARHFHVTWKTIDAAITGRNWSHVV